MGRRSQDESFDQAPAGVRFGWGAAGAEPLLTPSTAVVVVDVLSFSTAVTIATGRGTAVYPHPWPSPDIESFGRRHRAEVAVRRREVDTDHPWSLSPEHLLSSPIADRLVLPSPNGSGIAAVAGGAAVVVAGCLRNASAVCSWLTANGYGEENKPIAVIAAGEQWPGGQLRPALEDLLGAGAIIAGLPPRLRRSVEAEAARILWSSLGREAEGILLDCSSGRELAGGGYVADVLLAAETDADETVPLMSDGAFYAT